MSLSRDNILHRGKITYDFIIREKKDDSARENSLEFDKFTFHNIHKNSSLKSETHLRLFLKLIYFVYENTKNTAKQQIDIRRMLFSFVLPVTRPDTFIQIYGGRCRLRIHLTIANFPIFPTFSKLNFFTRSRFNEMFHPSVWCLCFALRIPPRRVFRTELTKFQNVRCYYS